MVLRDVVCVGCVVCEYGVFAVCVWRVCVCVCSESFLQVYEELSLHHF